MSTLNQFYLIIKKEEENEWNKKSIYNQSYNNEIEKNNIEFNN